jgi:16S rRNA (guanine966-N2)-methyltransferase
MGQISGARCLDLFTGSGILGLEALSRGAAFVYSIEKDPETLSGLKVALELLKAKTAHWQVVQGDAVAWLQKAPKTLRSAVLPFDIIFIDPPYDANLWGECLTHVQQQGWLNKDGIIYLESNRPLTEDIAAAGFEIYKKKKASSVYAYLARSPTP